MESPERKRDYCAGGRPLHLSLPMYDLPELAWAQARFSTALLAALDATGAFGEGELPYRRERPVDLPASWRDPRLLLSQTCGYPLVTSLRGQVRVVTTPCYGLEGCDGAWMRSALVVRAGDASESLAAMRGSAVCAINGRDSNSGMNLLRAMVAPLAEGGAFFREVLVTGAHVASLQAVSEGRADLAAIDCVTWGLLTRVRPAAIGNLRVLGWTGTTPGLPLITARAMPDASVAALRAAVDAVLLDPALRPVMEALRIVGFEWLDEAVYQRVADIEQEAAALSYPVLR